MFTWEGNLRHFLQFTSSHCTHCVTFFTGLFALPTPLPLLLPHSLPLLPSLHVCPLTLIFHLHIYISPSYTSGSHYLYPYISLSYIYFIYLSISPSYITFIYISLSLLYFTLFYISNLHISNLHISNLHISVDHCKILDT